MSLRVIRGLPGVGKSHYAKNYFGGALVLEGDQRFITPEGKYKSSPTGSRDYLTNMLEAAFANGLQSVIVTTASAHAKSIQDLVDVATKYGHETKVMWLDYQNGMCRNEHDVPRTVVAKMRHHWQLFPGEIYAYRELAGDLMKDTCFHITLTDCPPAWYLERHSASKIIFLDVDGVLNDNFSVQGDEDSIFEDRMKELCTLVLNTGAKIVLSSSWGYTSATEKAIEYALGRVGLHLYDNIYKIDGTYFEDTKAINAHDRDWFIKDWLQYHPEVTHYVVLDDWDYASAFPDHFVHTFLEKPYGLTEKVRLQAEAILNKEVSS